MERRREESGGVGDIGDVEGETRGRRGGDEGRWRMGCCIIPSVSTTERGGGVLLYCWSRIERERVPEAAEMGWGEWKSGEVEMKVYKLYHIRLSP